NAYTIALFIHMLGLVALFGGFVVLQQGGMRFRRSITWQEARNWLGFLRTVPGMLTGGMVLLLASGLYMTREQWGFRTPWVVVSIGGLAVTLPAAYAVVARRLALIHRDLAGHEGAISEEARPILQDAPLWSWVFGMNGSALGVLWLMSVKPGWTASITIPL